MDIFEAIRKNNLNELRALIEQGADINQQTNKFGPYTVKGTPLHDAVVANNVQAVKLLIESGADITLKDADGVTPFELLFDTIDSPQKKEMVELFKKELEKLYNE